MIVLRSIEIIIMLVYSKILIVIVIIIDNSNIYRYVNLKKNNIHNSFICIVTCSCSARFCFLCLSPMPCNLFLVSWRKDWFPEKLTISIVLCVSHFQCFIYSIYLLSIYILQPTIKWYNNDPYEWNELSSKFDKCICPALWMHHAGNSFYHDNSLELYSMINWSFCCLLIIHERRVYKLVGFSPRKHYF